MRNLRIAFLARSFSPQSTSCIPLVMRALAEAGAWLEELVGRIVASQAWRDHGVLFVVWDEGDGRSSVVPLIVASPDVASRRVNGDYDHFSLLAAIEDQFGLPRLGAAKDASPLTDLVPPRTR